MTESVRWRCEPCWNDDHDGCLGRYPCQCECQTIGECRHCGERISRTNFALGASWTHTDRRSSQCLIFAAPNRAAPKEKEAS